MTIATAWIRTLSIATSIWYDANIINIVDNRYHGCWYPGDAWTQRIKTHLIDQIIHAFAGLYGDGDDDVDGYNGDVNKDEVHKHNHDNKNQQTYSNTLMAKEI